MHCIGGQRGGCHHSAVGGVLEFSHPCLVSALFIGPSPLEIKFFFRNFFPLVTVLFWGFLNQLSNWRQKCLSLATKQSLLLTYEHEFKLQTNVFIASDEIVSATHLQIRITRQTNMFMSCFVILATSGTTTTWCAWGRTSAVLYTNPHTYMDP